MDHWVAAEKAAGRRIGFTCGSFDLLHAGHVQYLAAARELCDRLMVAVNSDASVSRYKSPLRPIVTERERMYVVAGLASVDAVTLMEDDRPLSLLLRWKPDLYIKGGDYAEDALRSGDAVREYGGEVAVIRSEFPTSSSKLIERVGLLAAHAEPEAAAEQSFRGLSPARSRWNADPQCAFPARSSAGGDPAGRDRGVAPTSGRGTAAGDRIQPARHRPGLLHGPGFHRGEPAPAARAGRARRSHFEDLLLPAFAGGAMLVPQAGHGDDHAGDAGVRSHAGANLPGGRFERGHAGGRGCRGPDGASGAKKASDRRRSRFCRSCRQWSRRRRPQSPISPAPSRWTSPQTAAAHRGK